jgi:hypothetical protein
MAVLPNGDLVVGGSFIRAGGVPAFNVSRWNGTAWTPMGTGVDNFVRSMTVMPNGDVIAATDDIKIYNSCGKFNLNESADLVRRSKLIITHDTGLMHIAAALKKPIVSIWGNTVPDFGMTAYYGNNTITDTRFEVTSLSCRPCSKIGYKQCPKKHFKCMELQSIDLIAKYVVSSTVI